MMSFSLCVSLLVFTAMISLETSPNQFTVLEILYTMASIEKTTHWATPKRTQFPVAEYVTEQRAILAMKTGCHT
jgi:hypothetical protein